MWYIYSTLQGKHYPLEIKFSLIDSSCVIHDYHRITGYCQTGCKNYNQGGGCPPKAPQFSHIAAKYPYGLIICATLSSQWKPEKVKKSKSKYIHFRFQDVILSKFLTNLGYSLRGYGGTDVFFLNNGYCMGCGNKRCSFKAGEQFCRYPLKRTYSLEATGVDVQATISNLFGFELQWYRNNNYNDVQFMAKSIGLFAKTPLDQKYIQDSVVNCLQGLTSTKYKLGSNEYEEKLREIFGISNALIT